MDPYKISQSAPASADRPPKPADHRWYGVREFWSRSYGGKHIESYEEGVALARVDLEAGVTTNRDAIFSASVEERDQSWEAKRDGYTDTAKKAE